MDGGAWWATVYGVTQSRTRLKRLSTHQPPSYTERVSRAMEQDGGRYLVLYGHDQNAPLPPHGIDVSEKT